MQLLTGKTGSTSPAPSPRRRDSRRGRAGTPTTQLLVAIGIVVLIGIAVGAGFIVSELREKAIEDAKGELVRLDTSLAEQTARAIQSVDLILASIVDELRSEGIDTPEEFEQLKGGRDTHEILRAKIAGMPQLDAVTLIARDGRLVNFSRYYPIPPVNVADRAYFETLRDKPADAPFLSEPVRNRGTGTWTIYLARRVSGANGAFVGLVLGAVNLAYFEELYQRLAIGEGSAISLWRRDGMLLARYPVLPDVGKTFKTKTFTEVLQHADSGVYETDRSIDGVRRIVATRAVHDYPIVVNVTRTLPEVLTAWRRQAAATAIAAIVCAGLVILSVWLLTRRFAAYEALTQAVLEREEANRAREQAEAQLSQAQKLEAIGQLTSGVAHDFNNLLTAILGNVELLERGLEGDPKRSRQLAAVRRGAERAATLTKQLLAFSRRQRLVPTAVELNSIVRNMEQLLRSTLGGTIEVRTSLNPSLWPARVDPTQIELVILNLSINARDAMPEGGMLTIETHNVALREGATRPTLPPGDYVAVVVRDTGCGMPPDVLERAFDPFFTTKEVGKGSGLGLSQVYGVAQQSGGGVAIETEPGEGTSVAVYLPRTEAAAPRSSAPQPAEATSDEPGHERATILLADDDAGVRPTIGAMLREIGYRVVETESGAAALEALERGIAADVLLVDFAMPGMNGAELARRVRLKCPDLAIVFVTGNPDTPLLDGEEWVLQKPFRSDQLAAKLSEALTARGRTQQSLRDKQVRFAP